tara:strand:- start:1037 stop:3916 length:2880 start_codon:yes stop_codon:yes gene_type:complete
MSFYTSLTGLNAATTELAVTSNNIANSGTSGFKRSEADFGDIFATSPLQKASSVIGAGVSLKSVSQEFSQGNIEFSANSLDLAITGDGFFALESPDGTKIFTRNGGFMLNEQNQMVNSAGQALMALPVDSTNKADFSEPLSALAIPRQTVAEFSATTEVELGLNLPSDSVPILETFNPSKEETYHKTTSLTVYGASGSSHLATIYYVKTAAATADTPFNKWQTYVSIDGTEVDPQLIQASDKGGDSYFVNKFGEIKTRSELLELQRTSSDSAQFLITTGTEYKKYSFDNLSSPVESQPATVTMPISDSSTYADNLNLTNNQDGVDISTFSYAQLTNMFQISVDQSAFVDVGIEHLVGKDLKLSGSEIAFELTNVLNSRFGDEKTYDFSNASDGLLTLKRGETEYVNGAWSDLDSIDIDIRALMTTAGFDPDVDQIRPDQLTYLINQNLAASTDFPDVTLMRDNTNKGFQFFQSDATKLSNLYLSSTDGDIDGVFKVGAAVASTDPDLAPTFGTEIVPLSSDSDILILSNVVANGDGERALRDQRYGIKVTYSDGKFLVSSGSTGDDSSIEVRLNVDAGGNLTSSSTLAEELLGISALGFSVEPQSNQINNLPTVRGQASTPAIVNGSAMGVDPRKSFTVNDGNKDMTVIIDGISAQFALDAGQYSIGTFTEQMQSKINQMGDSLGRTVSGVKVDFNDVTESLIITGATSSDESFIQIAGSSDWGLEDIDAAFGATSTYISLENDLQGNADVYVSQSKEGEWIETTDKGDFDEENIPYWSPIFLDKGELTFDTSGSIVSPIRGAILSSEEITGTAISIGYNRSTQFNAPFAVLSQSQNGAAEGNLVGVNIGDDGLVVASYSNGSQKSLGKIIMANFATPKGLRQIGDASYFETSESGAADYGEPGAAGFGTLRAGARERSNVDLTAELVDLITAQRNFQANAKAIETSSSLTQTIINIRG